MTDFKPGDKVRLIKDGEWFSDYDGDIQKHVPSRGLLKGTFHEVTNVDEMSSKGNVDVDEAWKIHVSCLEKVTEDSHPFDDNLVEDLYVDYGVTQVMEIPYDPNKDFSNVRSRSDSPRNGDYFPAALARKGDKIQFHVTTGDTSYPIDKRHTGFSVSTNYIVEVDAVIDKGTSVVIVPKFYDADKSRDAFLLNHSHRVNYQTQVGGFNPTKTLECGRDPEATKNSAEGHYSVTTEENSDSWEYYVASGPQVTPLTDENGDKVTIKNEIKDLRDLVASQGEFIESLCTLVSNYTKGYLDDDLGSDDDEPFNVGDWAALKDDDWFYDINLDEFFFRKGYLFRVVGVNKIGGIDIMPINDESTYCGCEPELFTKVRRPKSPSDLSENDRPFNPWDRVYPRHNLFLTSTSHEDRMFGRNEVLWVTSVTVVDDRGNYYENVSTYDLTSEKPKD